MKYSNPAEQRQNRETLSEGTVIDAIQNQRRRYVLYYLQNHNQPVKLEELIEQVAAWELCTTTDAVTPSHRKSVYSAIHQTHLPYLEDLNLAIYDRQRKEVSLRVDSSEFGLYLANDPHTTVPWYKVYLVLATAGLVVAGLMWFRVWPVNTLPVIVVAILFVIGFAVTSLLHWLDIYRWNRRMEDMPPDFVLRLGDDVTGPDRNNGSEDDSRSENDSSGGKRG